MDFEELKKEEDKIAAEYNERYKPYPYHQVFYPPASGEWKVEALYVDGFFEAANYLLEGIVTGALTEGVHGVAAVFLSRHYLELEIKYTLFHSRWLKHEDENAADSEIESVKHTHTLQSLWDLLMRELRERVPSFLDYGLDLEFVSAFVSEFHHVDGAGWRFRYPPVIGVTPSPVPPLPSLGIDFGWLLFNLKRTRDILNTLDGMLIEQHGQNADWENELNNM